MHEKARVKTGFFAELLALVQSSRRETALIGAAALILLLVTGYSFWLTQRRLHDAATANELNAFNAKLTQLVQLLRTVESSQRGYLITNQQDFLEPYNRMSSLLMPLAKELQATAPKELAFAERVTAVLQPLSAKLEEMRETIALSNIGQHEGAIARVKDGYGLKLTEQIEDSVRSMQNDGAALVRMNEAKTRRLQDFKFFIDGIGAILILTFSFLSLWLLLSSNAAIRDAQEALSKANASLEETVAQRTAALKRANEEVQRFAYIVSHDLRSPLINIMGFTSELETLRKELFDRLAEANALAGSDTLSKDFDEAFGFIKSSIARMDRLIGAILKISREGSRPLNPETIDAKALVDGLVAGVAHQIREKGAHVVVGALPPVVTDRLALEQIFSNLIENAIKFLKPGAQGEIRVEGASHGAEVTYSVLDNGRGIDQRDHQRIFELFRRAGPQDVPGDGMGLAYVSALVRRLGGSIKVESALGRGSNFKLTLPTAAAYQKRMAA
jgi:signal transduction histidine kinase